MDLDNVLSKAQRRALKKSITENIDKELQSAIAEEAHKAVRQYIKENKGKIAKEARAATKVALKKQLPKMVRDFVKGLAIFHKDW